MFKEKLREIEIEKSYKDYFDLWKEEDKIEEFKKEVSRYRAEGGLIKVQEQIENFKKELKEKYEELEKELKKDKESRFNSEIIIAQKNISTAREAWDKLMDRIIEGPYPL